ncbi:hypothetical protein B0H10DRAFT_911306 [Mycena sp. CBHHK59/15]|nr:hypothetical protein B0H10DRAFT_911306 [Mycena sp. CBHHK59/15]
MRRYPGLLSDCWENGTSRSEVEEFLSLLTEIAHLQLMVTMRGAERPARVKWSRPFLPPLDRLDDMSARQTFLDIVDNIDGDELTALLALTDNLPLAITLMANVASFEGGQSVLNRWADETTGVLSEGLSKRANLEKSIMISLSSPRMLSNPNARTLLSLLSLLPEGISDTTLRQMHLPFAEDVPRSRSTLLRCSLIYAVGDGRLRVLVPIREYVRGAYPPPADAFRALCTYFYDLASLFRNPNDLPGRELIARLAGEFANVRAVTAYALAQGIDLEDTVRCTIDLLHFNASAQTTSFDFTKSVEETVEALGDPVLKGDYLLARARVTVGNMPCEELASEALRCFEEKDNLFGRASHFPLNGRFQEAIDAADTGFRLAQQLGDLSAQALCLTASSKAHRNKGDLHAALAHGRKARQLSQASGNMTAEAWVSQQYATCCVVVGDYTGGSELCAAITSILSALGLADIEVHAYRNLLNVQAEIFHRRTEYEAAHALHMRILKSRRTIDDVSKAWDMLNIAQIDIELGDLAAARQKVDDARRTVTPQVFKASEMFALADILEADLAFHRGQYKKARTGFSRALAETTWADLAIIAIEKLSNVALKTQDILSVARYSTLLLASARKAHDPAAANQALRRLGDIFLSQGDPTTARNLFQVALDGFRLMGIHRATGDCLVRMGEIWASEGQPSKAIEAFSDARPLFEKSSQAADVARCDERVAFLRRDK